MAKKQSRGGIERKFLTSILWVGVIPMTLALIIGYVFAREGQWMATQQNQATAARKTAEGVDLAMRSRLMMTARVAQHADVIKVLKAASGGDAHTQLLEQARLRLRSQVEHSPPFTSFLRLYDPTGRVLLSTAEDVNLRPATPNWFDPAAGPRFVEFTYVEEAQFHAATAIVPVYDTDEPRLLGYLAETQSVDNLLIFAMGHTPSTEMTADENLYEIVYLTELGGLCAYLVQDEETGKVLVERSPKVDPRLIERIRRQPDVVADQFFLWRYATRGQVRPVLLAYHRLSPDSPMYFLVYRPVSSVFANINLGAVLTVVVSGLVIALFCVIGYRIVNNNIIRPVSLLNEGAQIIRQGDFDLKLKVDTGDEIEELAASFNNMATALRHNIRQLEASEEKYRSLITSMRDGIYQTDARGRISFANPAALEIFGYHNQEDALGLRLRDIFVDEHEYDLLRDELVKNQFVGQTRAWVRRADNSTLCCELSATCIFNEDNEITGIEGTFRDVTQGVRLEQEARERSERISAINQIANVINSSLESGRVYESIVVELRRLVSFDYAAVSLMQPPDDAAPAKEAFVRFETRQLWPELQDGPEAAPRIDREESCAARVAESECALVINDLEQEKDHADQFPRGIRSALCVPLYASGGIVGTLNLGSQSTADFSRHKVAVVQQITPHVAVAIRNAMLLDNLQQSLNEVNLAREKLHEANEELKTLDEMKTNLLSNVSHELRTPLVAVMGYTDMILNCKAGPVNDLQREYLEISLRNIEKLVTLIENLLDFSRLHRGTEDMVFDTLDLVHCAQTSMEIVQPVADSRQIALSVHSDHPKVLVEGDKGKLGQVFNNLLSNAVKFNDSGGTVHVEIRVDDAMAHVEVSDTGIGIPPEAQDKIFTRFYQYDGSSTRKYGGTGIGLAIAQDIMRLHGSRITVRSALGEGSTFSFALPLSGVQQRTEQSTPAPLPTETHLLVELVTQDRALSNQVRSLLLSEGMDIIHAAYPTAAISLANKYNPDCIIIDTEAGPLGEVVIDEIVGSPSTGNIPFLLLTNDDRLFERYRQEVAGRVKRSFRKSTLLSGIHYALSRGVGTGEQLGDKVLCVDDDPEIVSFMARCLEAEGYEVEVCITGEEAIDKARTGEYWLVLLDIAMPGLDGWETSQHLKSDSALAGIKIYLVTAKPINKDIRRIHACGADGYLLKPFRSDDLVGLVQGIAGQRQDRQPEAVDFHDEDADSSALEE